MIPGSLWTNQLKKPQVFEIFLGPEMSSISWLYFSLESKKKLQTNDFPCFKHNSTFDVFNSNLFSAPKVFQQKDTPKVQFFLFVDTFFSVFLSPWRWKSFPGVARIVGSWCWKLLGVSEWKETGKIMSHALFCEAVMKRNKENLPILNIFVY